MVPSNGGIWNYNFNGIKHSSTMDYAIEPGVPLDYYDEAHRSLHFLTFNDDGNDDGIRDLVEDPFS